MTEQYKEDIYNNTADYFDRIMADKEHAGTSRPVHFISIRQKKGKYYLTYSNVAHGQLVGFAERFTKLEEAQKYLKSALLPLRETEDPMVFFSADNSKATDSVIAFLDKQNITFYMRNEHITKNFFTASNDLLGLQENVFDSASVAFINGIPQTSEETATQGYSQIDHGKLSECSQYFSSALKGSKLVMGKDAAIGELTAGTSDVVLLIAHADKLEIYMGGEKISMEELEKLKGEPGRKRPRTAYLFSCNTGDLDKTIGIFTKTHVASLSEILLKNDMVDVVVAPKHEIAVMEAKEVLNDLLKGKTTKDIRSNYKGWRQIAQLFKPKPSGKENINA